MSEQQQASEKWDTVELEKFVKASRPLIFLEWERRDPTADIDLLDWLLFEHPSVLVAFQYYGAED